MSPLFKKLNLGKHAVIHVLNAPESFESELSALEGWAAAGSVDTDEDWSALRFRRVERIKTMARNPANAISSAGKEKATKRNAA